MKKQNLKYWIRLLLVFMGLRLMSVPLIVVFAETEPPYLAQPLADEGVLGSLPQEHLSLKGRCSSKSLNLLVR